MNLFLALLWLICAAVLFAYEHYIGGDRRFRIHLGGSSFSGAWLMLALGVYNLLRWWGNRSYQAERRAAEIARANREWERRRHSSEPIGPPDPNFNFTDESPPPPQRGITDQPPSNN